MEIKTFGTFHWVCLAKTTEVSVTETDLQAEDRIGNFLKKYSACVSECIANSGSILSGCSILSYGCWKL